MALIILAVVTGLGKEKGTRMLSHPAKHPAKWSHDTIQNLVLALREQECCRCHEYWIFHPVKSIAVTSMRSTARGFWKVVLQRLIITADERLPYKTF